MSADGRQLILLSLGNHPRPRGVDRAAPPGQLRRPATDETPPRPAPQSSPAPRHPSGG
jgi:hypothetical protein